MEDACLEGSAAPANCDHSHHYVFTSIQTNHSDQSWELLSELPVCPSVLVPAISVVHLVSFSVHDIFEQTLQVYVVWLLFEFEGAAVHEQLFELVREI